MLGYLLFAVEFIIYFNTLHHCYVLNDFSTISDNRVTTKGIKGIPEVFTHFYRYDHYSTDDGLYRPITVTIFAIEWWISPNNPPLAHFVNIFFYALTGWVLFKFWKKLLFGYNIVLPFVAVLLFVTHRIHTEVVAH